MRWFVTNEQFYLFVWGGLFVLRVLGFFNPFLYQRASCLDRKFLQVPRGTSGFVWVASKWQRPVVDISAAVAHLLPTSLPLPCSSSLFSPPSPASPFPLFSSAAVWLWAAVMHGTALGLSFRSPRFLLVRPRGFQRLQSFRVFLSERQKPMWRSCPDLWESAAQQKLLILFLSHSFWKELPTGRFQRSVQLCGFTLTLWLLHH